MRYKRIRSIIMAGVLGMLNVLFAYSQPADSLGYYLELAARNNPQLSSPPTPICANATRTIV